MHSEILIIQLEILFFLNPKQISTDIKLIKIVVVWRKTAPSNEKDKFENVDHLQALIPEKVCIFHIQAKPLPKVWTWDCKIKKGTVGGCYFGTASCPKSDDNQVTVEKNIKTQCYLKMKLFYYNLKFFGIVCLWSFFYNSFPIQNSASENVVLHSHNNPLDTWNKVKNLSV